MQSADHTTLLFQYISCYCLSLCPFYRQTDCVISIHLMLLFILGFLIAFVRDKYFNTSHVTVYLFLLHRLSHTISISIHLMLLFIDAPLTTLP